jgi:hypothetical protein
MENKLTDNFTGVTAGAAVTSPAWLPWLHSVSDLAALLLPIFGLVWIAVQIITKLKYRNIKSE